MNRKIGMISALINCISVGAFALSMLLGADFIGYLACMFIAFSFLPMISVFSQECEQSKQAAGYSAMIFAGVYAVIILLVYFAQTTMVRLGGLNEQALQIMDYKRFGLYFNYDLLGYGLMALSTFFIGLTIQVETKVDKWLKWLLLIHGIFFIACFIIPMLGVFSNSMEGINWIGVMVLEVWCLYFIPIGVLSFLHFKNKKLNIKN